MILTVCIRQTFINADMVEFCIVSSYPACISAENKQRAKQTFIMRREM